MIRIDSGFGVAYWISDPSPNFCMGHSKGFIKINIVMRYYTKNHLILSSGAVDDLIEATVHRFEAAAEISHKPISFILVWLYQKHYFLF